MYLLFVATSIPFPPRNGVELPLYNLMQRLSSRHQVDLIVLTRGFNEKADFIERQANVPSNIRVISNLVCRRRGIVAIVLRELFGIAPSFLRDSFCTEDLGELLGNREYDFVWVSPVGGLGFVTFACRQGFFSGARIALGHNDVKTTLYWDGFKQLLHGRERLEIRRLLQGLRLPWIYLYERRLLRRVDLVHVQTETERRRLEWILGRSHQPVVVDSPNGKNLDLEPGPNSTGLAQVGFVIYMTHLSGGRAHESTWFLHKVWPRVKQAVAEARLILIGTPPRDPEVSACMPEGVEIHGYVPNLADVFRGAALSVVPTRHGTGWINRISDSLTAGVPIVACSQPLRTVPCLQVGIHALKGDTAEEFADKVIELLRDEALRMDMAREAEALGRCLPTWEVTVKKIETAMITLVP